MNVASKTAGAPRIRRLLCRRDALGARGVRQVDQDATRKPRAGRFADLAALVEQVLSNFVGLELNGVRLVHLPPQLLVHWRPEVKRDLERRGRAGSWRNASPGV